MESPAEVIVDRTDDVSVEEARALIQGILRDFPGHETGTRPVHSAGVVATGHFRPSDVAADYTMAPPLTAPDGARVTVRFSSGTANQGDSQSARDIRGMAVRIHAPVHQGSHDDSVSQRPACGEDGDLDLVCMTLPVFFVRTVEAFRALTKAVEPPQPPSTTSAGRKVLNLLNLRSTDESPAPGDAGAATFSTSHPEICPALIAQFGAGTPESFGTCRFHAVHAFKLTNKAGAAQFARLHWEPVSGVRTSNTKADRYLEQELRARIGTGAPVRFVLRAQLADHGDDTADPSRPWPQGRRRVVLGQLTLDEANEGDTGEALEFNPHRLPAGMMADPADEIFRVRGKVYKVSAHDRSVALRDQRWALAGEGPAAHAGRRSDEVAEGKAGRQSTFPPTS